MKRLLECFTSGKRFVIEFPGMDVPKADRDEFERYFVKFRQACPDAKPHIHGSVSYSRGIGFRPYSADFDLSHLPSIGAIQLPNGRLVRKREIAEAVKDTHRHWVAILGYSSLAQIKTYADRVLFEMRSMSWAAANWEKISATKTQGTPRLDEPTSYSRDEFIASYARRLKEMRDSDAEHWPQQVNRKKTAGSAWGWSRRKPLPTDRIACDTCSLADVCKAFRQGSVCAVPNTEGDSLRKKFGTRSSSAIIAGLQELMQENSTRIRKALDAEAQRGEEGSFTLDPELTKLIDKTVIHGEKVAKLVDPKLRPGPAALVQVNNNTQKGLPSIQATPQQLTATVIRELEEQGMKREEITPEIINDRIKVLASMSPAGDINDDDEYIEDAEVQE